MTSILQTSLYSLPPYSFNKPSLTGSWEAIVAILQRQYMGTVSVSPYYAYLIMACVNLSSSIGRRSYFYCHATS